MRGSACLVCISVGWLIVGLSGCASESKSDVVRLGESMVAEQEQIADQARLHFFQGEYADAAELFKPLCAERTTSQPLYLCELGCCHLAMNDKVEAQKALLEAYTSLESFLDATSEKKAMTLWRRIQSSLKAHSSRPASSQIRRAEAARPAPPRALHPPYGVLLVAGDHTHQPNYAEALAADARCRLVGLTDEADVTPRRRELNERLATRLGIPVLPDLRQALARDDDLCAGDGRADRPPRPGTGAQPRRLLDFR